VISLDRWQGDVHSGDVEPNDEQAHRADEQDANPSIATQRFDGWLRWVAVHGVKLAPMAVP
jgi:hypothetical protein